MLSTIYLNLSYGAVKNERKWTNSLQDVGSSISIALSAIRPHKEQILVQL